jgi:hypothetical protein
VVKNAQDHISASQASIASLNLTINHERDHIQHLEASDSHLTEILALLPPVVEKK